MSDRNTLTCEKFLSESRVVRYAWYGCSRRHNKKRLGEMASSRRLSCLWLATQSNEVKRPKNKTLLRTCSWAYCETEFRLKHTVGTSRASFKMTGPYKADWFGVALPSVYMKQKEEFDMRPYNRRWMVRTRLLPLFDLKPGTSSQIRRCLLTRLLIVHIWSLPSTSWE